MSMHTIEHTEVQQLWVVTCSICSKEQQPTRWIPNSDVCWDCEEFVCKHCLQHFTRDRLYADFDAGSKIYTDDMCLDGYTEALFAEFVERIHAEYPKLLKRQIVASFSKAVVNKLLPDDA